MGEHELEPIQLPEAPLAGFEPLPAPDVSKVVEVKVIASTLLTLFCGVLVAWLNAVQASPGLLAGLPSWAQFLLLTAIPPALAFAAGYVKPSNRV